MLILTVAGALFCNAYSALPNHVKSPAMTCQRILDWEFWEFGYTNLQGCAIGDRTCTLMLMIEQQCVQVSIARSRTSANDFNMYWCKKKT